VGRGGQPRQRRRSKYDGDDDDHDDYPDDHEDDDDDDGVLLRCQVVMQKLKGMMPSMVKGLTDEIDRLPKFLRKPVLKMLDPADAWKVGHDAYDDDDKK
jgi:hypothetical protein